MSLKQTKYYQEHSIELAIFKPVLRRIKAKYGINYNLLTLLNDIRLYTLQNGLFTRNAIRTIYKCSGRKIEQYFYVLVNLGFIEIDHVSAGRTIYYKETSKVSELIRFYSNVHTIEMKEFSIRYNS